INHHQGGPFHVLRNGCRSHKCRSRTRHHIRVPCRRFAAMNNLSLELAKEALLFSWDSPGTKKAALLAFLALSLFAHAVCFYIFQVVYPPTVTLLPPPARVALITPASEEGRTLLRWIDAEDPAVAFTTHRPAEARLRALPKVEHVPSYHG